LAWQADFCGISGNKFDDKRSPPLRFLQVAIGAVLNLRCRLVHLVATVKFGFEQIYARKSAS